MAAKEWFDLFLESVCSNYQLDVSELRRCANDVTELLEHDPFASAAVATPSVPVSLFQSSSAPPLKRQVTSIELGPSVKEEVDDSPTTFVEKKQKTDTTLLRDEKAADFVNSQVKSGAWRLEKSKAYRKGFDKGRNPTTDAEFEFEFCLDGTERSCFDHKELIKSAGFTHYSEATHSGWSAFKLVGSKKGFGRQVL
jgi:hypothetical protein